MPKPLNKCRHIKIDGRHSFILSVLSLRGSGIRLIHEFREIRLAHIALLIQRDMECKRCTESVRSLANLAHIKIFTEQWAIIRMSASFDNLMGTLNRILATKVGKALLCDDDINRMLAVVDVSSHRNNGTDKAVLGS